MSNLYCLRCKLRLPIILFICLAVYWFFARALKFRTAFSTSNRDSGNFTAMVIANHEEIVKEFYEKRMSWTTSKLGAILFKNEPIPKIYASHKDQIKKSYLILIYKTWYFLQNRNVHFGPDETQPLKNCSVKNCRFTSSENMTNLADAIIVHLRRNLLPKTNNMADRNPDQRIIFFDDESPPKLLLDKKGHLMSQMFNVFNWSMSYRSDADIPVPYGRTIALKKPKLLTNSSITTLIPFWKIKKRDVLISTVLTDCNISYKLKILDILKEYISIYIHNKCYGDSLKFEKCEGKVECNKLSKYLFYLVFENTKCKEYMTEKLFFLAYSRGAIPIIQGPSVEDCKKLLPPNSYIHMDDYRSIKDLVTEIMRINDDEKKLLSYHAWRNHFEVVNEHGYYGTQSQHLCRICEALNYNENKPSIYHDRRILKFLNAKLVCRK